MKYFLLFTLFLISGRLVKAQVSELPQGKYVSTDNKNKNPWDRGDVILLNNNTYKLSTADDIGEYRFSATAQRIFFTSGPLKNAFAKILVSNNTPAIVLPLAENAQTGIKLTNEVWCYYKKS